MVSGGYRRPTNPAPASGPGRLSKRTDGGPGQKLMVAPGGAYGDRAATLNQERSAPMAQADNVSPAPITGPASAGSRTDVQAAGPPMPPFGGPSQRPNEPITHGVDIGPGAGSEVMPQVGGAQPATGAMTSMLRGLSATATSGSLAELYQAAMTRGV